MIIDKNDASVNTHKAEFIGSFDANSIYSVFYNNRTSFPEEIV